MSLPAFRVSFDYRCPFAKNIHLHLIAALREDADFDVTFEPWTLSQGHREAGAPDVWDDSSKEADLIALASVQNPNSRGKVSPLNGKIAW